MLRAISAGKVVPSARRCSHSTNKVPLSRSCDRTSANASRESLPSGWYSGDKPPGPSAIYPALSAQPNISTAALLQSRQRPVESVVMIASRDDSNSIRYCSSLSRSFCSASLRSVRSK